MNLILQNEIDSSTTDNIINFSVDQATLSQAIAIVARAVMKNPIQPVLNNILFTIQSGDSNLILTSTDLALSIRVTIPVNNVENSGSLTIPAAQLLASINKLPKQSLIQFKCINNTLKLSCGRAKFEIKGVSADEFPLNNLPSDKDESVKFISINANILKQALDLVSYASDRKELNSILNGICIEITQDGLEIAATDGSRLSYYKLNTTNNPDLNINHDNNTDNISETRNKIILPYKTTDDIKKLIEDIEDEDIDIYLYKNSFITIKSEQRQLSSNLIEGTYPKYQQLIPDGYIHRTKINKQVFLTSLERVAVLANTKSRVVRLLFEESGLLTVSAQTPEIGDASDQLDMIEFEGQDFSIAFNVDYMLECLKNISCTEIELHMSESLKPIIVKPLFESDNNKEFEYIYLLMPIQLRKV